MRFKRIFFYMAGFQLALFPMSAFAQSSDFDRAFARQGAEARVSFTIPIGASPDQSKTKPRLNFGIRHYTQPSTEISKDWMLADRQNYRDISLGFTVEDSPKWMMNEQVLRLPEQEQANIGTAGKIGLGVAAVTLVGVAVLAVLFATEDFDDD